VFACTHTSVFLCTTRPPPRPTLFPYTTLFRSIDTSRVITVREDDSGEPVKKDRDVYKVPVGGVGTMLSREISVEITDASLENQISEFNKAQLELAEELGISTE